MSTHLESTRLALNRRFAIIALLIVSAIVAVLSLAAVSRAQEFQTGEAVTVPAGKTIDSMFVAAGNSIDIAGTVKGNVYCAGQTVTVTGTVEGDIFCAAQILTIEGQVLGSVYAAGQTVALNGTVGEDATLAGQSLIIRQSAVVGRDTMAVAQTFTVDGTIQRDATVSAAAMAVKGQVGRNVKGDIEKIGVSSSGVIGGNLEYTSTHDPMIQAGGQIAGEVRRTQPQPNETTQAQNIPYAPFMFSVAAFIYTLLAMLVVATVIALLMPQVVDDAARAAIQKPGMTFLSGLAIAFAVPAVLLVLFLTIIGIPLALLAVLVWMLVTVLSGPFAGYALGRAILRQQKIIRPVVVMLLGSSIILITYFIPILGFFTMLATYLYGLGMLLYVVRDRFPRPRMALHQPLPETVGARK